jgi:AAA15 family ATPase/GTPase
LENIISLVHSVNKEVTFVFTVSPVRHIKDGFVENTVSKSHLVSALYTFIEHNAAFNYFPSYEIMLDELRDYRFYAEDMLHPNQTEIDYIWMQFWENFINTKAFATMQEVSDIQKALQHKPFHPDSVSHQQFLVKLKDKIKMIQQKSSGIRF